MPVVKLFVELMSLEATINDKENVAPDGIRKLPFLSTSTAWDNFYINLQTTSVKDTHSPQTQDMLTKKVVGHFNV